MAIKKALQYLASLTGGEIGAQYFNDFYANEKPNVFQIRNFGNDSLFVSVNPGISTTKYDIEIPAGATRKLTVPYEKCNQLYLLTATDADIHINAFFNDNLTPADLDETNITVILNYAATPDVKITDGTHTANVNADGSLDVNIKNVPVDVEVTVSPEIEISNDSGNPVPVSLPTATETKLDDIVTAVEAVQTAVEAIDNAISGSELQVDVVTMPDISFPHAIAGKAVLSAGVKTTVKNAPGYVFAIKTALTDLVVEDGTTVVWENNYDAAHPFYNSTSIELTSATGGNVYIVYK